MRAVVLIAVGLLTVACGSDDGVELDSQGNPIRQCAAVEGLFQVVPSKTSGQTAGCPADVWENAAIGFGSFAAPGEVTYTADGCGVNVRTEWQGTVYTYDLQVEPDGSTAHGTGHVSRGAQCSMAFTADLRKF